MDQSEPIKGYSTFPKAPAWLEPDHQIVKCHIRTLVGRVLPLCRYKVGVFCSPGWLVSLSLSLSLYIYIYIYIYMYIYVCVCVCVWIYICVCMWAHIYICIYIHIYMVCVRVMLSGRVHSTIWIHHMDADQTYGEKTGQKFHKNATSHIEKNPGSNTPQSSSCTITYLLSLKPSK